MTTVQKVILTTGVVLALALAGTAVYASTGEKTATRGECVTRGRGEFYDPTSPTGTRINCLEYGPAVVDEPPLYGTTPFWLFGSGAAVVLTALGLVLVRRPP